MYETYIKQRYLRKTMFDKINLLCHMYFLNDILVSIIRVLSNSSIHGPGRFFFGNTENYLFSCLCYLEYHKINDFFKETTHMNLS